MKLIDFLAAKLYIQLIDKIHRNSAIKYIFLLCCVLFTQVGFSKEINWLVYDFPPYYIVDDYGQGMGRDEGIIKLLDKMMPNYKFNFMYIPGSRLIHELSDPNKNFCTLSLYKTPKRKKHIIFTISSSTIGLPVSIAMRKNDIEALKISIEQPLSLSKLLENKDLMLGAIPNRSYGIEIDTIISNTNVKQVTFRPGNNVLESITKMLVMDRVDIVLGYPDEHEYIAKKLGLVGDIISLMITETPKFSEGYIGCNTNEIGKKNIAALETTLQKMHKHNAFYKILTRWLPRNFHPTIKEILKNKS